MSSPNAITLDYSQSCKPTRELVTEALSHFPLLTSKDTDWDGMYLAYDRIMQPGKTQEIVTPRENLDKVGQASLL